MVGIEPDVYSRFKDDINIVTEALEKGSKLVGGKIVIDEEKKFIDAEKSDSKIKYLKKQIQWSSLLQTPPATIKMKQSPFWI